MLSPCCCEKEEQRRQEVQLGAESLADKDEICRRLDEEHAAFVQETRPRQEELGRSLDEVPALETMNESCSERDAIPRTGNALAHATQNAHVHSLIASEDVMQFLVSVFGGLLVSQRRCWRSTVFFGCLQKQRTPRSCV